MDIAAIAKLVPRHGDREAKGKLRSPTESAVADSARAPAEGHEGDKYVFALAGSRQGINRVRDFHA